MTSTLILSLALIALFQRILCFDKPVLYEVGALQFIPESKEVKTKWPVLTLPLLDLNITKPNNNLSKTPRCLCKLPLPIPIPVPFPSSFGGGVGVNNNVAATQLLSDGRTVLYNNQGQIIGYLPAGSTVENQMPTGAPGR